MQIYYGPKTVYNSETSKVMGAQLRDIYALPQNLLVYQKSWWLQIILGLWNLEHIEHTLWFRP
jgi:hypothetical protein